jgi:hypothetical protein
MPSRRFGAWKDETPLNIFVVQTDPAQAARDLCDAHVIKMAQILCTAAARHGVSSTPYRPTHMKHPAVLWAGNTVQNWRWTVDHGLALGAEYERRYGKRHKSLAVIDWAATAHLPGLLAAPYELTPFAQCMPDQYRGPDAVEAYRRFYRAEKIRFAKWSRTLPPSWWSP